MSKTFCKWLAVIFNLAEKGNGWPKDLLCARSAYISKEEESNIKDLLKYRVITVLPAVPGEKDTRIMEEPLEVTTRRVALLAQRKCFEDNARTRPMLQGVKEVHQDRKGGAYDVLDEGDKKVMRYIMAGGLWTGKHA